MTSLSAEPVAALRETLRHLDLPMLDALARRERGNPIGRIARAVALALRLELDAAALILEPLALQSDVARAIGGTVLAPRSRRVTRARADSDRDDRWVDTIDPELGAMLVSLAAALSPLEDAARDVARCARSLARLEATSGASPATEATRTTTRIAHASARVRSGEIDRQIALDRIGPFASPTVSPETPFHVVVRALATGALWMSPTASPQVNEEEEARIEAELERAERIAAETGTTLLDACAATALGTLCARVNPRDPRGLLALERAGTLLAHGDAPSLEHDAEHHRAVLLLFLGRWADAIVHLRAAREAAHAERAGELELLSAAFEVLAELALGDKKAAYESAAVLGEGRIGPASDRNAAFAWVARALAALSAADREGAEDALTQAEGRVRERNRQSADAYVLVEILGMLFDAARGALHDLAGSAAGVVRFAEENGVPAAAWFDLLTAILGNAANEPSAPAMLETVGRLRTLVADGMVSPPSNRVALQPTRS